jgi:hypothetical protein
MAYRSKTREVDPIDLAAVVVGPVLAAMVFGVFSLDVQVFNLGSVLTDPLWSSGQTEVTVAALGAVLSVVWIYVTNETFSDAGWSREEMVAIGASLASVPVYVFIPAFNDVVSSNDLVALIAALGYTGATVYASYIR